MKYVSYRLIGDTVPTNGVNGAKTPFSSIGVQGTLETYPILSNPENFVIGVDKFTIPWSWVMRKCYPNKRLLSDSVVVPPPSASGAFLFEYVQTQAAVAVETAPTYYPEYVRLIMTGLVTPQTEFAVTSSATTTTKSRESVIFDFTAPPPTRDDLTSLEYVVNWPAVGPIPAYTNYEYVTRFDNLILEYTGGPEAGRFVQLQEKNPLFGISFKLQVLFSDPTVAPLDILIPDGQMGEIRFYFQRRDIAALKEPSQTFAMLRMALSAAVQPGNTKDATQVQVPKASAGEITPWFASAVTDSATGRSYQHDQAAVMEAAGRTAAAATGNFARAGPYIPNQFVPVAQSYTSTMFPASKRMRMYKG